MSSIEGLVDEYGPKGQWKELGAVLDRMDRRRLAAGEQEMWYRARGIVEFRTNQRARATEIFEEGVRSFPTSGWLNYGLGQEYEGQGRIDEIAACFRRPPRTRRESHRAGDGALLLLMEPVRARPARDPADFRPLLRLEDRR